MEEIIYFRSDVSGHNYISNDIDTLPGNLVKHREALEVTSAVLEFNTPMFIRREKITIGVDTRM